MCFDNLVREFNTKYPLSTRRYKLFMMRQPKGKTMSFYINTLLEAADIANIYELTPDKLLITLTLAVCTDNALKQDGQQDAIKETTEGLADENNMQHRWQRQHTN